MSIWMRHDIIEKIDFGHLQTLSVTDRDQGMIEERNNNFSEFYRFCFSGVYGKHDVFMPE